MTKKEFVQLELFLRKEVAERTKLGGYNADSNVILNILKSQLLIVQHLMLPKPRAKKG